MTGNTATFDVEEKPRAAVNQDGLLDLFVDAALVLTTRLALVGWRVNDNPAVFAGLVPLSFPLYFEPTRKRLTYPRLGCPDYKPTREIRFALIALTVFAVLGLVVFLFAALTGIRVLRPLFELAPVWVALGGAVLLVLLSWWYRSRRFLLNAATSAVAVAPGHLFVPQMLVRLTVLAGAVGVAMTATGACCSGDSSAFPRAGNAARPGWVRLP